VLRTDPARRARAHLLWSLNPLLLWGLIAAGHVDTVAAACGLLGLLLVKPWRRDEEPHLAHTDNLYRLFARSFLRPSLAEVDLVIVPVVVLLAALLLWRLPDRRPDLPAVMPAFALSLAWMLAWPYQRPWYDAAVMCLLVLYPATRLDWIVLGQLALGTVEFMPGMPSFPPRHSWLATALNVQGNLTMPLVRLAALLAVVALCAVMSAL
jgi:hypothetical protein